MQDFNKVNGVYTFDSSDYGIVFTTTEVGNMAYQAVGDNVEVNRQKLASIINRPLDNFVFAMQTHSDNFHEVTAGDCGRGVLSFEDGIADVDCLFTFDSTVVLNAFFADCTPVYVYSKNNTFFAIIHAGWQGTVKGIVYKCLNHFREIGVNLNDLQVVIGPSISQERFEVEADVINKIEELSMIDGSSCYNQISEFKYLADVKKLNKLQAVAAGIKNENIAVSEICSYNDELLFSFRENNNTGRMLGCIYKK